MDNRKLWYNKILKAAGIVQTDSTDSSNDICVIIAAMKQNNLETILSDECLPDGYMLIAADNGYQHLNGRRTQYVVGDFDSLGFVPENETIIQHPVRKDDTDMMLAVKTGFANGKKNFVLLGGIGGRLDHTIANLNTLAYIKEQGGNAVLIGDNESVFLIQNESVCFDKITEGTISVFSYGDFAEHITIRGLSYEVYDICLSNTFPLGVSNEFVGKACEIKVGNGSLLILCENP